MIDILPTAADGAVVAVSANTNINEELDNLMDISIEIASNKRMKKDNIKPFSLTFKDQDLEKKVGREGYHSGGVEIITFYADDFLVICGLICYFWK